MPSNRRESDLEHVLEMLLILDYMSRSFVHVPVEVNFTTVAHMIYIHDAGEILAGDLAYNGNPDYGNVKLKVKRRETAAFRLLTKQIEDAPAKNLSRELYKRVREKSPTDKEAQLTDLIDKVQAVRFGLSYVFPGTSLKDRKRRQLQLNHSTEVLLSPAEALAHTLKSPHSKTEVMEFMKRELKNFITHGYRNSEIKPYLERIASL